MSAAQLANMAAAVYADEYDGAALPDALADALTPDALAAWMATHPPESPDLDAYARRMGALTRTVTAATFAAARVGSDALTALMAQLPALPDDRADTLDTLAAITDPETVRPTAAALDVAGALWTWAQAEAPRGDGRPWPHPLAPIVRGWIDAHRPAARHAVGPTGIAPRMMTRWRLGEAPLFEAPPDAVIIPPADAPALAYLPGMAPDWPPHGPLPPFWADLLEHAISDARYYGAHPTRARVDALRVVRLALYVTGRPPVRQRVGRQRVTTAARELAWALYPGDEARGVFRQDRLPALARTLDRLDLYRRTVAGGVLFPVRRAAWQADPQAVAFDITYPPSGGSGPAYDRRLMAAAGPDPRRFLAYLSATFAHVRGSTIDLDAFTAAVHTGLAPAATPAARRQRRRRALDALEWLADWKPPDGDRSPVDFVRRRDRLTFRYRPALPPPHGHAGE